MAISVQIYDNTTGNSNYINLDLLADFLADSAGGNPNELQYFISMTTSSLDTSLLPYAPRYAKSLSTLALNGVKRSSVDSAVAYDNIKTMIDDYVYDYIYGHTADKYSSGCTLKAPISF